MLPTVPGPERRTRREALAPIGAVLLAALLTTAGCNGETTSSTPSTTAAAGTSSASHEQPPAANPAIKLEPIDKAGLEAAIEQHAGKVVFVDFWATWCAPCKADFPHTVELAKKYHDQGLAVISVSCDEADTREEALKFLQSVGAEFQNFIASDGLEAIDSFAIEGGALPHYRLYDRQGVLIKSIGPDPEQGIGPEEVEALVRQAVEAPKS